MSNRFLSNYKVNLQSIIIGKLQSFAVLSLNFGQLSIGLGIGYSSVLIPQLETDPVIVISVWEAAWVVSLIALGQIGGAVLGSALSAGLGRKGAVLVSTVPSIAGWTVTAISQNVTMLYVARLLVGLGMGMSGTVHPVYVCELSSSAFRGPLASSGVIVLTAGVVTAYILGTVIQWKLCAWLFLGLQVVMALLVLTVPESPSWLVNKRLYSRADAALGWLGRDQEEFASEVEQDIQNRKLDNYLPRHHSGNNSF